MKKFLKAKFLEEVVDMAKGVALLDQFLLKSGTGWCRAQKERRAIIISLLVGAHYKILMNRALVDDRINRSE